MVKHLWTTLAALLLLAACNQSKKNNQSSASAEPEVSTENPEPKSLEARIHESSAAIASETFAAMSAVLMHKIQTEGADQAVVFCSERAWPITDSLAQKHGVQISRKAVRYRNPANKATTEEAALLSIWEPMVKEHRKPEGKIVQRADGIDWYGAIVIPHPRCLDCHGLLDKDDIFPETLAEINKRYPNDKAVNFELGDLRGMWKISYPAHYFDEKTN
ncbi:MAG: DUF3365 domain-containing protein [Bacteroidia bacterium]